MSRSASRLAVFSPEDYEAVETAAASCGVPFATYVAALVTRTFKRGPRMRIDAWEPREPKVLSDAADYTARIRISEETAEALGEWALEHGWSVSAIVREIATAGCGASGEQLAAFQLRKDARAAGRAITRFAAR